MKTTKKLSLKSLAHFIGIMSLTLSAFSCAKSGNDPNRNSVFANCANCDSIAGGQTFYTSKSTDTMYGMTLDLSYIGAVGYTQYGQVGQTQYAAYNPIVTYVGAVAAQGTLLVNQPVGQYSQAYSQYGQQYGGCFMPAGAYTVGTLQAGQYNQGAITSLILTAVGPTTAIIVLDKSIVSAKSPSQMGALWSEVSPVGRLAGPMTIQSINGVACNIGTYIQ